MGTVKTFIKNSMANYGRTAFRAGVGVIAVGIIARHLNLGSFGQYAYITAITAVLRVMVGMGVPSILTREIARDKAKASTLLSAGLSIQATLSVIMLGATGVLFYWLTNTREAFHAGLLCGVAMILESWRILFASIFQAFEKMEYDTMQTCVTKSLYLVFLIILTIGGLSLPEAFLGLTLSELLGAMFGCGLVFKRFASPKWTDVGATSIFLLKEGYPIGIKKILRKLGHRVDTLLLAALKTTVEVGIFHGAYKIIQSLTFVTEALAQALFPILSRFSISSESSFELAYQKAIKFVVVMGLPVAIFLNAFSEPVLTLILGKKFLTAAPVLKILGWVLALMFITSFTEKMLIAGDKQHLTTILTAIALGVKILLDLLLIPKMSFIGASIATFVGEMIVLSLSFYFISAALGLGGIFHVVVKPLFAGLVTYGMSYAFRDLNLFVGGFLLITIYAGILFATKIFTEEETDALKAFVRELLAFKPMKV